MNQKIKKLFLVAAILSTATTLLVADCDDCGTDCCTVGCTTSQNLYQPHAFSVSISREVLLQKAAWTGAADNNDDWYGTFGVSGEYWQNWGEVNNKDCCDDAKVGCCESLGAMPFWSSDNANQMTIGDNSGNYDVDGYQMGLGPITTTGTVRLDPKVYQAGGQFFLYVGSHRTERGFFAKIGGPVGVMSIDPRLGFSDTITAVDYPAGALNTSTDAKDTTAAPYDNINQSFAGETSAGFLKKMQYGKIDCKQTTSAKFGDLSFALGYNVYADETKHLGVALRFSAPTGNKAEGCYVLEPIWGRNGHWAAGGELIGHWRAWESDSDDNYLDLWFDGTAEHLFRSKHMRSFDLKANGRGSKYLLLGKYTGGVNATFQNCIENAINITTLPVESTFAVEGNFTLMADFHWSNWSFALGYAGWGRTCEKLKLDCKCPGSVNLNDYAVLGRQTHIGELPDPPVSGGSMDQSINDLCEPLAQIGKSQARFVKTTNTSEQPPAGIVDATNPDNRIPEDVNDALDICGQRAHKAYTSEIIAQFAHTWRDSDYDPYIGLSGGAEFSHTDNSAVKYWKIGVQGGLAF